MTDPGAQADAASRPRPQYGEYATAEEQRARIQEPPPRQATAVSPVETETHGHGISPAVPASAPPRPRTVDRIVTFALLAYGLVNVVTAFPAYIDYSAYAEMILGVMGVDAQPTDPAAGRGWGIAAALVLAVGWLATLLISLWSLRRGRLTWWIPLTAGVVFSIAAGALLLVPIINDPALWQALIDSTRAAG